MKQVEILAVGIFSGLICTLVLALTIHFFGVVPALCMACFVRTTGQSIQVLLKEENDIKENKFMDDLVKAVKQNKEMRQ